MRLTDEERATLANPETINKTLDLYLNINTTYGDRKNYPLTIVVDSEGAIRIDTIQRREELRQENARGEAQPAKVIACIPIFVPPIYPERDPTTGKLKPIPEYIPAALREYIQGVFEGRWDQYTEPSEVDVQTSVVSSRQHASTM